MRKFAVAQPLLLDRNGFTRPPLSRLIFHVFSSERIMSSAVNGQLIPQGGGDVIPLVREILSMGRRESCDICLRFPNVSGLHCELAFRQGHWILRDLNSTNGVKVNGSRVTKKVLHPGDTITIAKRTFTIQYTPTMGKKALEEILEDNEDLIDQPLLEKAGLLHPPRTPTPPPLRRPARQLFEEKEVDEDDDD
jgi:adenylate cyclase